MIVCSCNVISDHEVRDAASTSDYRSGRMSQVYRTLGRKPKCARCQHSIKEIVRKTLQTDETVYAS